MHLLIYYNLKKRKCRIRHWKE